MAELVDYQVVAVSKEEDEKACRHIKMYENGFSRLLPGNLNQAPELIDVLPKIRNFEVRITYNLMILRN